MPAETHVHRPLIWPPVVEAIQNTITHSQQASDIYIVGGAVRDAYLHRPLRDIDLATPGDGRPVARHIADVFDGDFYSLDAGRGVGRALIAWEDEQIAVDVARFRGPDLTTDLQKRDFTLNALAVQLGGDLQRVIDPLGGLSDIKAKRLRRCSPDSIQDDPVRALRAVRASITFGLMIDSPTRQDIRTAASQIVNSSPERVRDELFHILEGQRPSAAVQALDRLGLLDYVLPEVAALKNVKQGPPHQYDVWRHTLLTTERLHTLLNAFSERPDENASANLQIGLVVFSLNHLRRDIRQHLSQQWPNHRSHSALLTLAALLHDAGKPATRTSDNDNRIRFLGHEQEGARIISERAAALRLSNEETTRLTMIVQHHMRPHWLHANAPITPRGSYRFWRDTGPAGVDICLLAMADYLGTYGMMLVQADWLAYLETQRTLLERFFQQLNHVITSPPLLTGQTLIQQFDLTPGPLIGRLLASVREAQAAGQISTKEEALNRVKRFLSKLG